MWKRKMLLLFVSANFCRVPYGAAPCYDIWISEFTSRLWSRNSNFGLQLQASKYFGSGSRTIWSNKN